MHYVKLVHEDVIFLYSYPGKTWKFSVRPIICYHVQFVPSNILTSRNKKSGGNPNVAIGFCVQYLATSFKTLSVLWEYYKMLSDMYPRHAYDSIISCHWCIQVLKPTNQLTMPVFKNGCILTRKTPQCLPMAPMIPLYHGFDTSKS
jgi:hypothetical protein